jgi:hypothetical protein
MVHGFRPSLIVQAVLDAAGCKTWYRNDDIAAALRAVADHVTPENYSCFNNNREYDFGMSTRNDEIREAILLIAAELESLT